MSERAEKEYKLTKSYVNACDPDNPPNTNIIMSQVFNKTRADSRESLLVNMGTGERITNLEILSQVSEA